VLVYDSTSNSWSAGPSIDPRATCGAVVANGSVHIFGGESQATRSVLADVLRLDDAGAWQPCPPMLTPRSFARAVTLKGSIYVVGGSPEPQRSHAPRGMATVERLD
jgi:hypothetical protein